MPANVILFGDTEVMRADRLLSILMLLQTHGLMSARALAERLEVSERTVHRDMEALSLAGVPVYAERGRRGGWALVDEYRTDLTGLTEAELRSLMVASAPGVLADLGLGEAADRALIKLLAGLPEARRKAAESARGYLYVDPSGWRRQEEMAPFLPTLELALRRSRRIEIAYERAYDQTVVERIADPLGLVAKGSVWYLAAMVEGRSRTYRASRLRRVRILDEPAVRPDHFDLPTFWAQSSAEFRAALPVHRFRLRVSPDGAPRVRLGWRFATVEDESEPAADGWSTVTIRADSEDVAVECVLSLGGDAKVLEPASIRERARVAALALLAAGAAEPRAPTGKRSGSPPTSASSRAEPPTAKGERGPRPARSRRRR
jgi:predicted DNA-binding transcriptional regulator YafY